MDWKNLLIDHLHLTSILPGEAVVPFAVDTLEPLDWRVTGLQETAPALWRLDAQSTSGIDVQWRVRFFADTCAAEIWGEIRNNGSAPLRGVRECRTLALPLALSQRAGLPWVRSINGAHFIPTSFPVFDFGVVDRQLLRTPESGALWPLTLACSEDGRSSSETLPCAIFCDEPQEHGLAMFLEWSGLWKISFTQAPRGWRDTSEPWTVQLDAGLRGLRLDLQPGQSLPLPRLLVTAFQGGLDAGGNSLRRHIRKYVMPKLGGAEVVPFTSYNHFFGVGLDFTAEGLKGTVDACATAGIEYFCVDAGWFPGGFRQGIGNWSSVNQTAFPEGITPFADYVRAHGMQYGTWFEPEWAHRDSELHREHPEWFWPTPPDVIPHCYGWPWQSEPEYSLINLGLREVRDWWLERIGHAYEEWHVRWIRWDFNQSPRPNWDDGVAPGELGWRQIQHVLGLYQLLDDIMAAFPDLVIEQCASGGHRIDLGMVRRGHTIWMNDLTTNPEIIRAMQHGLNTVLPANYANTNVCLQQYAGHNTYLQQDALTDYELLSHMAGSFGYSGRLGDASAAELERVCSAFTRFKQFRHVLMGDYQGPPVPPRTHHDRAEVLFREGKEEVTFVFNDPPGAARCEAQLDTPTKGDS